MILVREEDAGLERLGKAVPGELPNRYAVAMSTLPLDLRLPYRKGAVEYTPAFEGDHEAIYQTLLHVFHGPERDEFLGTLSDPTYKPEQRLLVKVDNRIASHVHLTERVIRLGAGSVGLHGVMWVGTLPEYRGKGFAQNLMRLAGARAKKSGVLLLSASTSMPQFYRALGWGVCGRHCLGLIASRNLPAGSDTPIESRAGTLQVRPWRQVELGGLMKLYEKQFASTPGTVVRSEEYWRWLVNRRVQHVIWVACLGERVHGYAFVKDHRVLEIAADPERPEVMPLLLGRVRSEALERAYPEVLIHAPPGHAALDLVRAGGGQVISREEWDGEVFMYHAPDPARLLNYLLPEIARRVKLERVGLPLDLGLVVDDERWLVHIGPGKSSRIEPDKLGRRYLTLSSSAFVRLVLGHTGIERAISLDGVTPSASTAVEAARVLFPQQTLWRSPLDSVTA